MNFDCRKMDIKKGVLVAQAARANFRVINIAQSKARKRLGQRTQTAFRRRDGKWNVEQK